MSVCLSVRMKQLGFLEMYFIEFENWVLLENTSTKFNFYSNLTRIISILHEDFCVYLSMHLAEFFIKWQMFHTEVVLKIKTHILCSITASKRTWGNVVVKVLR
jgi:hypothetical protein